ncbi:MAG: hypothetical protein ACRD19_12110 [Terriglobia bacterium]
MQEAVWGTGLGYSNDETALKTDSGTRMLTDNFYNGEPWSIGLKRFLGPRGARAAEARLN